MVRVMFGEYDNEGSGEGGDEGDGEDGGMVKDWFCAVCGVLATDRWTDIGNCRVDFVTENHVLPILAYGGCVTFCGGSWGS